jgi:hypothetical protein
MVAAVSISAPETNTNDSSRNISQTHHLAVKAAKTNKGKRAIEKNAPRRKEVSLGDVRVCQSPKEETTARDYVWTIL